MASSEDSHVPQINSECQERFSVYVKTSWKLFTATIQEIEDVALDKKKAYPKYSEKVATELNNALNAAGIIAGINIK